jgi:hypothetical protein
LLDLVLGCRRGGWFGGCRIVLLLGAGPHLIGRQEDLATPLVEKQCESYGDGGGDSWRGAAASRHAMALLLRRRVQDPFVMALLGGSMVGIPTGMAG